MSKSFLAICIALICNDLIAQENKPFNPQQKYNADSLQKWGKELMLELSRKQPGFYRYTSKNRFDTIIDSTLQTIRDSLTEIEIYRKLKPLIAQIGCVHTGISLSTNYEKYLKETATLLPLEVFIDSTKRVFITKNHSENSNIPIKSELLSIDNQPINKILSQITAAIPMDGYNESGKILLLNYRFAFWYQVIIEAKTQFVIQTKTAEKIQDFTINGAKETVFPNAESIENGFDKMLNFKIKDNIATLTIHTFAKSQIKKKGQKFKKFIKKTFKTLKIKQIQNLVIDIRNNSGGTDANAALLSSYLINHPYCYWDRIEVTEPIAQEIKGIARLFYKKPVKKDSIYIWRKTKFTKEFNFYEKQYPAKNAFKGNIYLIINGLCLSSAADFSAIISHNTQATIIGQETGGGYQGNTSGMMPSMTLQTGLKITVPLQKYVNAVNSSKNFGRGTMPTYKINYSVDEWLNKKDLEMDFVLKILGK